MPIRLIDLLESGIKPEERSFRRLAELLGVSRGCVEYHVRNLRRSGQITPKGEPLAAKPTFRQLPFQLEFDFGNVVEMSDARRRRKALGTGVKPYCHVFIVAELPAELTAEEIGAALASGLDAHDVKVFGDRHDLTQEKHTG